LQRKASLIALQNLIDKDESWQVGREKLLSLIRSEKHRKPAVDKVRANLKQQKRFDELFSQLVKKASTGNLEPWLREYAARRQPSQTESLVARAARRHSTWLDGPKLEAEYARARAEEAATQVARARKNLRQDKECRAYHPDEKWIELVHQQPAERSKAIAWLVRRFDPRDEFLEEAIVQVEKICSRLLDDGLAELAKQLRLLEGPAPDAYTRSGLLAGLLSRLEEYARSQKAAATGRKRYRVFPLARSRAEQKASLLFDQRVAVAVAAVAGRLTRKEIALDHHQVEIRRRIRGEIGKHWRKQVSHKALEPLVWRATRDVKALVGPPLIDQARQASSPLDKPEAIEALQRAITVQMDLQGSLAGKEWVNLSGQVRKQIEAIITRVRRQIAVEQVSARSPMLVAGWRPGEEILLRRSAKDMDFARLRRLPVWKEEPPPQQEEILEEAAEVLTRLARKALSLGQTAHRKQLEVVRVIGPSLVDRIKAEQGGSRDWVQVGIDMVVEKWNQDHSEAAVAYRSVIFTSVRNAISGIVSDTLKELARARGRREEERKKTLANANKKKAEKPVAEPGNHRSGVSGPNKTPNGGSAGSGGEGAGGNKGPGNGPGAGGTGEKAIRPPTQKQVVASNPVPSSARSGLGAAPWWVVAVLVVLLVVFVLLICRRSGLSASSVRGWLAGPPWRRGSWLGGLLAWFAGWWEIRSLVMALGPDQASRLRLLRQLGKLVQVFGPDKVVERLDSLLLLPSSPPPLRVPRDDTGITATPNHASDNQRTPQLEDEDA
jgi:hypothetical protein